MQHVYLQVDMTGLGGSFHSLTQSAAAAAAAAGARHIHSFTPQSPPLSHSSRFSHMLSRSEVSLQRDGHR